MKLRALVILATLTFSTAASALSGDDLASIPVAKHYDFANVDVESVRPWSPVSATLSADKDVVFVADYGNIFRVNLKNGDAHKFRPPKGYDGVWNPTGIHFDKSTSRLYVANYKGKNIIVSRVVGNELVLISEINNEYIVGPENIDSTEDRKYLAIADYDSNKIIYMEKDGAVIWTYDILSAHGVAFLKSGDIVSASLGTNQLTYLSTHMSRHKGVMMGSVGGSSGELNGFLYPTSLAVSPSGKIAIIDAHQNTVKFMNDRLEVLGSIGQQGGQITEFNTPYGILWVDDDTLIVVDTKKRRLAKIDTSGRLLASVNFPTEDPELATTTFPDWIELGPTRIEAYSFTNNLNGAFRADLIYGSQWLPSFKRLWPGSIPFQAPSLVFVQNLPTIIQGGSPNRFTYGWNWNHDGQEYSAIGSPQGSTLLVLKNKEPFTVDIGWDRWPTGGGLFRGQNLLEWKTIAEYVDALQARRERMIDDGDSPLQIFEETMGTPVAGTRLENSIVTGGGRVIADFVTGKSCEYKKDKPNLLSEGQGLYQDIYLEEVVLQLFAEKLASEGYCSDG